MNEPMEISCHALTGASRGGHVWPNMLTRRWRVVRAWHTAFLLAIVAFSGCAQFDLADNLPIAAPPKPKPPARLTALWTHTVLNQPGRSGVRGFGGRVMFFGKDRDKPIGVEGTLTIYAYDDTDGDGAHRAPVRKYVFTADQLPEHYSKSALGHSYSVWLPWDEVGGAQRQIGLVAQFEGRKGGVVMSEMSRQILPGVGPELAQARTAAAVARPPTSSRSQDSAEPVKQAAHEADTSGLANSAAAAASNVGDAAAMSTTTIAIPPSFARRALAAIDQAGPQPTAQQRQLDATARLAAAIEQQAKAEDASRASGQGAGGSQAVSHSATEAGPRVAEAMSEAPASARAPTFDRSFCTRQIPGSSATKFPAKTRSRSEATSPRRMAVWPATDTSRGPCRWIAGDSSS